MTCITVIASYASTGNENAYFHDSAGNDAYAAYLRYGSMARIGYHNAATNFAKTYA